MFDCIDVVCLVLNVFCMFGYMCFICACVYNYQVGHGKTVHTPHPTYIFNIHS